MAPGKDVPMDWATRWTDEQRREAWEKWLTGGRYSLNIAAPELLRQRDGLMQIIREIQEAVQKGFLVIQSEKRGRLERGHPDDRCVIDNEWLNRLVSKAIAECEEKV